jgi:hypothetical protein
MATVEGLACKVMTGAGLLCGFVLLCGLVLFGAPPPPQAASAATAANPRIHRGICKATHLAERSRSYGTPLGA